MRLLTYKYHHQYKQYWDEAPYIKYNFISLFLHKKFQIGKWPVGYYDGGQSTQLSLGWMTITWGKDMEWK